MVDRRGYHHQVRLLQRGVKIVQIPLGASFPMIAVPAVVTRNGAAIVAGNPGDGRSLWQLRQESVQHPADSPSARGEPRMASTRSAEEGAFFAVVADKHITAFPEGMGEIRFRMGDGTGDWAQAYFPRRGRCPVLELPLQLS